MLDPVRVEPAPWRNGAGSTRELAVGRGSGGQLSWRISVATLEADAPFSLFPGMDRVFVAMGPLRLTVDGDIVVLSAGEQTRFAGELPVAVCLDAPTTALNVMTRRDLWRAEVHLHPVEVPSDACADATVLLAEMVADVRLLPSDEDPT